MKRRKSAAKRGKAGQVIIFMMAVMVIALLAVLWNYDLHNIVSTKMRIDNAGDAAALSAARWQGITLNMVGELNLIQAAYVCQNLVVPVDTNSAEFAEIQVVVDEIADVRSRLSLNGPLMGYVAAQSAAFLNLKEKDELRREDDFSAWLADRAEEFQTCGQYYRGEVEEPYPNGWNEYGNLLASIAENKMVVDCANPEFFLYYNGWHILFDTGFYRAVYAGDWCYFKDGQARIYIDTYEGISDWGALPDLASRPAINSEYFGLDLESWGSSLVWKAYVTEAVYSNYYPEGTFDSETLAQQLYDHVEDEFTENYSVDTASLAETLTLEFPWHTYAMNKWLGQSHAWPTYPDFPFEDGMQVKDEYNYGGADAVVECYINAVNITPNMRMDSDWVYWRAAAKPFGYLEDPADSNNRRMPVHFGAVFPAFHNVRLIHNELSSGGGGQTPPNLQEHLYVHLPDYMQDGLPGIEDNTCYYCGALIIWEDPAFRAEGSGWLETNQQAIDDEILCAPPEPTGGGGGGGGGARGRG
jgi:hypothetical protein